jgi:hypothetical protein
MWKDGLIFISKFQGLASISRFCVSFTHSNYAQEKATAISECLVLSVSPASASDPCATVSEDYSKGAVARFSVGKRVRPEIWVLRQLPDERLP